MNDTQAERDSRGSPAFDKPRLRPPLPALRIWQDTAALPAWIEKPHMARKETAPHLPSFAAQRDAAVRRDQMSEKLRKHDPFSRLARRRVWSGDWLTHKGFDSPETLAGPFPFQDVLQHLQGLQTGVIKPVHATNAWGVFPFERTGDFSFRNLFDGTEMRMAALLEWLQAPMQKYMFPNKWQIEELVTAPTGGVPDDFKAYAFAGHVPLILQVRRTQGGNRYKFYDADWTPVLTGKYAQETDMDLPPPQDPESLLTLAQSVSAALPAPFCRIDLFETTRGPVVGELTPEPGGYHLFDADVDRYMGVFYEMGQAQMAASTAS